MLTRRAITTLLEQSNREFIQHIYPLLIWRAIQSVYILFLLFSLVFGADSFKKVVSIFKNIDEFKY